MRFEDYVVARRGRLVEHAVDLGVEPDDAAALVDRVLAEQRRTIERSAEPDPTTYAALERALDPRPPLRWRLPVAALVVVALVVAAGAWWLRPQPGVGVASFYGFGAAAATEALGGADLVAGRDLVRGCEPAGLVLGSDPAPGARVEVGDTVRLRVAGAPRRGCADTADRAAAWAFLGFVRGGPAPDLDDTVYVVLDGREPAVLPRAAVLDPQRWAGIRSLARDLDELTRDVSAYPLLLSGTQVPPPTQCGTPRPAGAGDRTVLRLSVVPRDAMDGESPSQDAGCPLTVDLYRDAAGVIDAVVVYSASGAGDESDVLGGLDG